MRNSGIARINECFGNIWRRSRKIKQFMDDEFKANANYFQNLYSRYGGRNYAAGHIEELANTRKAVLREYENR